MAAALIPHEVPLRLLPQLRACAGISTSGWRGRSGRRYVVTVYPIDAADSDDLTGAVLIAVRRDAEGEPTVARVAATDGLDIPAFIEEARAAGSSEIAVHRLAWTPAERRAVSTDLSAGEVL